MRFDIITIFPKIFDSYFGESILKRAQERKLISVHAHDLRKFTTDKHHKVDDSPYGGGAGMVLKIEPVHRAVEFAKRKALSAKRRKVILFSTRGKKFNAAHAKRFALCDQLILICGRYEGVDERVAEHIADEEISIGDYVLSGGEIPAMVVVDAVARQISGVLGKRESLEEIQGSYPTYTKPEVFNVATSDPPRRRRRVEASKRKARWKVPKVLLSGNHKNIDAWRKDN